MSPRRGITFVEVIVVLLIFILLAGLILTGVMRLQEAAAESKCRNNLKQLALAIHNYNTAYPGNPPQMIDSGHQTPNGTIWRSGFFMIWPYLECDPGYSIGSTGPSGYCGHSSVLVFEGVFKGGDTLKEWGGSVNLVHPLLIDPADATAEKLRDVPISHPDGTTGYYATGSYAMNGLIPWGDGSIEKSFPRGTANTIMIGERPQVCRTANGDTIYNLWGLGFYSPHMPTIATLTPPEPTGLQSTGQIAPVTPLPAEDQAHSLFVRIGRQNSEPQRPEFTMPFQVLRSSGVCDPRLPATPHRGGMQVAMADGSVRTFVPDTSSWVFWNACWPGEVTTPPE